MLKKAVVFILIKVTDNAENDLVWENPESEKIAMKYLA